MRNCGLSRHRFAALPSGEEPVSWVGSGFSSFDQDIGVSLIDLVDFGTLFGLCLTGHIDPGGVS